MSVIRILYTETYMISQKNIKNTKIKVLKNLVDEILRGEG